MGNPFRPLNRGLILRVFGLFFVTLATLMFELLLTRIFSVTMWYHYAFLAISIAMFGMTTGALLVYFIPSFFTIERSRNHLAAGGILFALSVAGCFLAYLHIPFSLGRFEPTVGATSFVVAVFMLMSIPFFLSGVCVCVSLTRYPQDIHYLYAFDLLGAAAGCAAYIVALKLTDGPTAVFVVAFMAAFGALLFGIAGNSRSASFLSAALCFALGLFILGNTYLANRQASLLRLKWVKGLPEVTPLYERWNPISRIAVSGNPGEFHKPFGWGLSTKAPRNILVRQLLLRIDSDAATELTAFNGDFRGLQFLKYYVPNLAHYLRPHSNVLVVGVGGGKDVLSALLFNQKSVTGVELNKDILVATNQVFGFLTGHLDTYPQVTLVNDEARSYLAREKQKYDIIQISLIDTWAATAAGAFVFTENSLYTTDAWKILLRRLTPRGILTVSRWYIWSRPDEMYRLTSLACASLANMGIHHPRSHILLAAVHSQPGSGIGIGTILVSKEPFSSYDVALFNGLVHKLGFQMVLSPTASPDPLFAAIASAKDPEDPLPNFPVNITAPTDDQPFFFQTLRLQDMFRKDVWKAAKLEERIDFRAIMFLYAILIAVAFLVTLFILVPLFLTRGKVSPARAGPLIFFFGGIGLGFMLVEISQMERFGIFLGQPTYSLIAVLGALLLSSGLGSMLSQGIPLERASRALLLIIVTLAFFGALAPVAVRELQPFATSIRISATIGLITLIGLFMGTAFPMGMRMAFSDSDALTPWLWGVNGAASVFASVLAVVISLNWGISACYWTGLCCYGAAFFAFELQKSLSSAEVDTARREPAVLSAKPD